jgi:hypothetical protein
LKSDQKMVFIIDEGSTFKAPIDKVWKLNMSEGNHSHPSLRNTSSKMEGEHPILLYETQLPDGSWAKNRVKMTLLPPVGVGFETVEGPMAGSKSFQYYTPKGNETGITVVGNWTAKGVPEDTIRQAVLGFLDTMFKEDQANLARMS